MKVQGHVIKGQGPDIDLDHRVEKGKTSTEDPIQEAEADLLALEGKCFVFV